MMLAVCLLSGGMDSATLAYHARHEGSDLICLHFNYGQRTERKERSAAQTIAGLLGAEEFIEIDLAWLARFGESSLTDRRLAIDRFQDGREGVPNTYVPFRNANLLSIATSCAEAKGAGAVFIGVQSRDYSGYPDCQPRFIEAFQRVVDTGTRDGTRISIMAPFLDMTKQEILSLGRTLGVPYEHTWSCYQDEEKACGLCGACYFRKAAFEALGMKDPIPYKGDD